MSVLNFKEIYRNQKRNFLLYPIVINQLLPYAHKGTVCYYIGRIYDRRFLNMEKAFEYYTKGLQYEDNHLCHYALGQMFYDGCFLSKNFNQAYYHFLLANGKKSSFGYLAMIGINRLISQTSCQKGVSFLKKGLERKKNKIIFFARYLFSLKYDVFLNNSGIFYDTLPKPKSSFVAFNPQNLRSYLSLKYLTIQQCLSLIKNPIALRDYRLIIFLVIHLSKKSIKSIPQKYRNYFHLLEEYVVKYGKVCVLTTLHCFYRKKKIENAFRLKIEQELVTYHHVPFMTSYINNFFERSFFPISEICIIFNYLEDSLMAPNPILCNLLMKYFTPDIIIIIDINRVRNAMIKTSEIFPLINTYYLGLSYLYQDPKDEEKATKYLEHSFEHYPTTLSLMRIFYEKNNELEKAKIYSQRAVESYMNRENFDNILKKEMAWLMIQS